MKITQNSWECLLIEDAEKDQITGIYSLVIVFGQLCGLLAPIASILVSRLTLVPAVKILYLNAFVLMTAKVVILYIFSRETQRGVIRMEETREKSLVTLAAGYIGILRIIGRSPGTIFALALSILSSIVAMLNSTFWQVIVNKKLLVPEPFLPLFAALKSVVAIIFLFYLAPRLTKEYFKLPLLTAFACFFIGQILLISAPVQGFLKYPVLCVSIIFDGFGSGALTMLTASLIALNANPEERARVMALLYMIIMAVSSPFGWIGGLLSDLSRNLPFVLNLCFLAAGFYITVIFFSKKQPEKQPGKTN